MPEKKSKNSTASVPTAGPESSTAVLAEIVETARNKDGTDKELFAVLEKHVLKADSTDNAVDAAIDELQKLAHARAALAEKKP